MSANRWQECPKCRKIELQRQATAATAAGEAYGKVSPDEYVSMTKAVKPRELSSTLRENWELGTQSDGEFYVRYFCSCEVCGLIFEFREKRTIDLGETKSARKAGKGGK